MPSIFPPIPDFKFGQSFRKKSTTALISPAPRVSARNSSQFLTGSMYAPSSVRRIKERGGGGAKISAAPAAKVSPVPVKFGSVGKENPGSRSTSRGRATAEKPSLRPIARMDKSAAAQAAEKPNPRRSTSSVPRGRSSSPSEFTRVLSDLRSNSSRVSLGQTQRKVNSVKLKGSSENCSEKSDRSTSKGLVKNGVIFGESERVLQEKAESKLRDSNNVNNDTKEGRLRSVLRERQYVKLRAPHESGGNQEESEDDSKNGGNSNTKVLGGNSCIGDQNSSSVSVKQDNDCSSEKLTSEFDKKRERVSDEVKLKSNMAGVSLGLTSRESKVANKVSSFPEGLRENVANKYPSRLHEKLAFLEGKVKRIASDIKRTKDMLDMNNSDSSKMILSDIQEKISGIEKAIGHVGNGDARIELARIGENLIKTDVEKFVDARSSVKGLSDEELEARLFPHHKLIRDRTISKAISVGFDAHILNEAEPTGAVNVGDNKTSSAAENAMAPEISASLSKEESQTGLEASKVQQMDGTMVSVAEGSTLTALNRKSNIHAFLMADEKLDEFDEQDTVPAMIYEDVEESYKYKMNDIGCKRSTGGWFVSEGESVLLAHDDGSCSFYDIANCEEKAEYKPPSSVPSNMWRDCWIIRAPSADGCFRRYVVAASDGNSIGSGFCSWDFYTKDVQAFHFEDKANHARAAVAPLSNNTMYGRNTLPTSMVAQNRQWWYKPCGPLIASTASFQRMVQIYDIRDGEQVMKWELQKPVLAMDYASPLHWRNRGKVVISEADSISLWDVSSLGSDALVTVSSNGRMISALHVNNNDAEPDGGVRQRISSQEAEGNDGVFCTPDSINVLDFRHPSGIGLKIPKVGYDIQSACSRGDSIYIGCSSLRSTGKQQYTTQIQQFSLRKQTPFSTYTLLQSNAQNEPLAAVAQVWGNSDIVMGVSRLGLFVFDSLKDNGMASASVTRNAKEIIGPDDMHYPSFDYLASRILLISKDGPARWRFLL